MRILDLTHPYADGMPVLNHVGTHVDAPAHQIADRDTLDDIPLEPLVTHALTVDVSGRPPGPIPLSELESKLHHLHRGDILFLCSDNARNWGTPAYWTGWSYPDAMCARALVQCGISAIGFDGPSADPVDSTTFDMHRLWLSAGRMIIENVANLTELPTRSQVVVAPIKPAGGNGGPARIFALLPDEHNGR